MNFNLFINKYSLELKVNDSLNSIFILSNSFLTIFKSEI